MDTEKLLDQAERDERDVAFPHFNAADAWALGALMVQRARERDIALAISIDMNGQKLFYYAFDGTHLNNELAAARKSRVAHVFHCSSLRVFCELQSSGTTIADRGRDPMDYLALGGALPIRVEGTGVVGTVCVSGLAHTEDHRFAVDCLKEFLREEREV